MSWILGREVLVASLTGLTVGLAARFVVPPTPRLAGRLRPYTTGSRTTLGGSADVLAVAEPGPVLSGGTLEQLVGPIVARAARALNDLVDRTGEDALLLKLRQAGMFATLPEVHRTQEYRVRQLSSAAATTALFGGVAMLLGTSTAAVLLLALLGFVVGVTRWRARIDTSIARRRERMRIELYTVNQLLAMTVRTGGGVVQAIHRVVDRGSGAVVSELEEVLRAHRGGRRLTDALDHAARTTAEPNAARTYKLLANGVEHGADLAEGLRALSEDIRNQRTQAIRRAATRRRAAMLVPIIAVLAPVMLLFIAAPLPSLVLGGP